jgi:hypothetical protein
MFKMMLKSLMKSSIDSYILPGTMTGTEILWIYLMQWRRDLNALFYALLYFTFSNFEFANGDQLITGIQPEPKETLG